MNEGLAALFGAFVGVMAGGVVDVLILQAQRRADARWRIYTELLPAVTVFPDDQQSSVGLVFSGNRIERGERERVLALIPRIAAGAGRRVRAQGQRFYSAYLRWDEKLDDPDAFRAFCEETERLERLVN